MSGAENPPAFPCEGEGYGNPNHYTPGMTLRDWFAGQALAGLMETERGDDSSPTYAYWLADAMLTARGQS